MSTRWRHRSTEVVRAIVCGAREGLAYDHFMSAGLFYVYSEPGTVDEAEFHDWYDNEHGAARLIGG